MRVRKTALPAAILAGAIALAGASSAQASTSKDPNVQYVNVVDHKITNYLRPLGQPTGLATSISGTATVACFYNDALTGKPLVRQGTEKSVGQRNVGFFNLSDSPNAMTSTAPAGVFTIRDTVETGALTTVDDTPRRVLVCSGTDYPRWASLHAEHVTTNRFALNADGSQGALIGWYYGKVDAFLQL